MPDLKTLLRAFFTLVAAALAGFVLDALGLPLGWLVGAMLVMIFASLLKLPAVQPTPLLPYVRGAVGTMLGASITPGFIQSFGTWWPSLLVMCAVMLAGGLANYQTLRRFFLFPRTDAALCSMPGGIAEMIILGEQAGADQRRVAIVHALRIALSILIIPVLAGSVFGITVSKSGALPDVYMSIPDWLWFAACVLAGIAASLWTRLPAPLTLVPLLASAGLHLSEVSSFHVPPIVSQTVQVMIGINVGARFMGFLPRELARVAMSAVSVVAIQIGFALAAAFTVSKAFQWDALALLLAYSPGGLAEMSLIAITMGREVAFVAFHHILRVLTALLLAPQILSRLKGASE